MMARERQKKSSTTSDDEAKKTQLMELPMDILVDIFLKLPAKSVGCIKCVSRTLLNSVSNISFSTTHTRSHIAANFSTATADPRDRLVCCFRDDRFVTLQSLKYKDNMLTKGRYAITVSSSTCAPWFLRFVFHNVFCLGTWNGDCMLVNALAGERGILRLPESSLARMMRGPNGYRESLFGMGFDDETNTYKIVRVVHESDAEFQLKSVTAHVLVLGANSSWRQIPSHPPCKLGWTSDPLVSANGAVHWLVRSALVDDDRLILSFDLRREEFYWTPTRFYYLMGHVVKLFSLRGCLAIVETSSESPTEIWVLKGNRWVRYYCYNDKLPFDFTEDSSLGEWEHGIFFTTTKFFCRTWLSFIDIRFGSITTVDCSSTVTCVLGLYDYSETLISLKDYGDVEEAHHQYVAPVNPPGERKYKASGLLEISEHLGDECQQWRGIYED